MINDVIGKLVSKCKLGSIIEGPERIMGGLLNRMYKIKTTGGVYAIKFLNPEVMERKSAKNNHILAETVSNMARNNGIKALPAKCINNEILQQIDGFYFLIYDWFDGKVIKEEEITIEKIRKVANELVKLHKIDFGDIKNKINVYYDTTKIDWDNYLEKIEDNQIKGILKENIIQFELLEKQSIESLERISSNVIVSHRDLDLSNVLWNKNEELVFIDWESAGLINQSMEVIETAWNWSGGSNCFDKNKFKMFVNTYKENYGDLNDFENAIMANLKSKFDWLGYNLKRITEIRCIDEEEKQLGKIEVIRTIDEIKKYILYKDDMKL